MVTRANILSLACGEKLIDPEQAASIRSVMGERYDVAVALFFEYSSCRIDALDSAISKGCPPEVMCNLAGLIKDNAAAIGAAGMAVIAHALEDALADAVAHDAPLAPLQTMVFDLRACFAISLSYFLSNLNRRAA